MRSFKKKNRGKNKTMKMKKQYGGMNTPLKKALRGNELNPVLQLVKDYAGNYAHAANRARASRPPRPPRPPASVTPALSSPGPASGAFPVTPDTPALSSHGPFDPGSFGAFPDTPASVTPVSFGPFGSGPASPPGPFGPFGSGPASGGFSLFGTPGSGLFGPSASPVSPASQKNDGMGNAAPKDEAKAGAAGAKAGAAATKEKAKAGAAESKDEAAAPKKKAGPAKVALEEQPYPDLYSMSDEDRNGYLLNVYRFIESQSKSIQPVHGKINGSLEVKQRVEVDITSLFDYIVSREIIFNFGY
jgi:hypothetical protein